MAQTALAAACRDLVTADDDPFFADFKEGIQAAIAVCATCPVVEACLKHALSVREPYGVWGGMSEEERARLIAAEPAAVAAGV